MQVSARLGVDLAGSMSLPSSPIVLGDLAGDEALGPQTNPAFLPNSPVFAVLGCTHAPLFHQTITTGIEIIFYLYTRIYLFGVFLSWG